MSEQHDSRWCRAVLADISDVVMGTSPSGDTYNSDGKGLPLVNGPVEFGKGPLDRTIVRQHTTNPIKTCREGDLLLCVRGSTTGRTNIAGFDAAIGRGVAAIRARQIHQPFLNYYLISQREAIFALGTGSTFPNITTPTLARLPIPIAPLNEQRRIVAKIEELFSDLDAGVAALERARVNLERYRAAVLKAAVEGTLTEQWRAEHPATEPATKLLERILAERRRRWEADQLARFTAAEREPPKGWQAKYVEPAAPDVAELPALPKGWCWTSTEQLSDETRSITYGVIKLGNDTEDGVPTLRCSNVRHLRLELDEVKKVRPTIAAEYERTFLRGGEVLVNVRGTLGGVVCVPLSCAGYNIAREVAMIAPVDAAISPTLAIFIASTPLQAWLSRKTRGIAYTGINIEALKMLPVPLPPLPEQIALVNEVETQLSVVAAMDDYIKASLTRAGRLRQSILKRAFEGKLVAQDPADEPAANLLERIRQRALKASSDGGFRVRRRTRNTSD